MHNIRSTWWMTKTNLFKWTRDLRILLIVVLMITVIHMHLSGLINFSHNEKLEVHFAILPFLTESRYGKIIFILPIFILFADAPFIDTNQLFLLMRSNRKQWIISQVLYIFITSVVYVAFLGFFSFVFFVPHLEWGNDWGSVIQTLSKTSMGLDMGILVSFPRKVIDYFTPYQAMFFSFLLQSLVITLMGMIILLINISTSQRYLGLFTVASLLMLDALIYSSGPLSWISPLSWMRLSRININEGLAQPSFYQILLLLTLLYVCLTYLIVQRARRYEI